MDLKIYKTNGFSKLDNLIIKIVCGKGVSIMGHQ